MNGLKTGIILTALMISGCNFVNEGKKNAAASFTEKLIENATGKEVDMMDLDHTDKNKANIQLVIDGKEVGEQFMGGMSIITATKDGIAFSVTRETDGLVHSVIVGLTGPVDQTSQPYKASAKAAEGALKFSLQISNVHENSIQSLIATEGEAEILSLSDQQVVINVSGKIVAAEHAAEMGMEKSFTGRFTLNYPAFNAIGISKKDLTY